MASVLATVLAISFVTIGLFYWVSLPKQFVPDNKTPFVISHFSPQNLTVAQGATFQINMTSDSLVDEGLQMKFENISVMTFNNSDWNSALPPQEDVFNCTFTPNPLILEPHGTNSSIITVELAEDAPTGRYRFLVETDLSELAVSNGFWVNVTLVLETQN